MNRHEHNIYEFGRFRLDADDRILLRDGRQVHLTEKVFNLLLLLVQRSGRLVTKEEMMELVWPDSIVEENNLTVSMSVLRKALGEAQEGDKYIETVPKRGYRFVAAVREMRDEYDDRPWATDGSYERDLVAVAGSAATTLAVLPLLNASGDSNLEYLSDGITESLINSVSQSSQIKVMARNTAFRYKGSKLRAQEIGEALNVEAVLTGSITQMANKLIVKVELIDVEDSSQLWGEQFKRSVSDILTLQATIVKRITETLWHKLTGQERKSSVKQYTDNFDAYLLYLKGIYFLNRRTEQDVRKALQYLEQAIAIDPGYALAYSALASCYNLFGGYSLLPPGKVIPKVKAAAEKALEIDGNLAEAHVSLGHVKSFHEWDWAGGEAEFKRAIRLNPAYAPARHWYGLWLRVRKQFDKALAELRIAQRLDPLSLIISTAIAQNYYCQREFDKAIAQFQHVLELNPDYYIARAGLGWAYLEKGRFDAAIKELQRTLATVENREALAMLGYAFAVAGREDEARGTLLRLREEAFKGYVDPAFMAAVCIGLNENDEALDYLEQAYEHRSEWLALIHISPVFDRLHADARFQNLLRRLGHTN